MIVPHFPTSFAHPPLPVFLQPMIVFIGGPASGKTPNDKAESWVSYGEWSQKTHFTTKTNGRDVSAHTSSSLWSSLLNGNSSRLAERLFGEPVSVKCDMGNNEKLGKMFLGGRNFEAAPDFTPLVFDFSGQSDSSPQSLDCIGPIRGSLSQCRHPPPKKKLYGSSGSRISVLQAPIPPAALNEIGGIFLFRRGSIIHFMGGATSISWNSVLYEAPASSVCLICKKRKVGYESGLLIDCFHCTGNTSEVSNQYWRQYQAGGAHPSDEERHLPFHLDRRAGLSVDTGIFEQFPWSPGHFLKCSRSCFLKVLIDHTF